MSRFFHIFCQPEKAAAGGENQPHYNEGKIVILTHICLFLCDFDFFVLLNLYLDNASIFFYFGPVSIFHLIEHKT